MHRAALQTSLTRHRFASPKQSDTRRCRSRNREQTRGCLFRRLNSTVMTKMPMHPIYRSSVQCNYSLGPVKPSRDGTYGAKKKPLPKKIEKKRWKRGEKRKEKEKENGEVMKNSRGGEHNGELLGSERERGGGWRDLAGQGRFCMAVTRARRVNAPRVVTEAERRT